MSEQDTKTQGQGIPEQIKTARAQAGATKDYTQYFKLCLNNTEAAKEYLKTKGLTPDTLQSVRIGYDNSEAAGLEMLVIPRSENRYTAIFTEDGAQIGDNSPFNMRVLHEEHENIFIVPGILDALSVEEAGAPCIALCEPASAQILKDYVEKISTTARLIICLYGEEWQQARQELKDFLQWQGIGSASADLKGEYENINARLVNERDAFIKAVRAVIPPEERYKQETAAAYIKEFYAGIDADADKPALSTGFRELDALLDGGINTGLYVIGAISSLGKTTFIIQLADYIAKQGQDVLFFSLEQPRREIMAKSISRETYNAALIKTGDTRQAKSTTGILNGRHYKRYTQDEKQIIIDATAKYQEYADRIRIFEGVGNIGARQIEQAIKDHVKFTGHKPIVFIDYLQIMAAFTEDRRTYTDKQAVDKNILELKRLSRNYTIIAISSFNRDSYTEPVTLASFKESGAIEYTSDVLIGLQYNGMDYQTTGGKRETENAHAARVQAEVIKVQQDRGRQGKAQDIQLKVLKNRNHVRGNAALSFYPCFNLYQDADTPKGTTQPDAQGFTTGAADNNPFNEDPGNMADRLNVPLV